MLSATATKMLDTAFIPEAQKSDFRKNVDHLIGCENDEPNLVALISNLQQAMGAVPEATKYFDSALSSEMMMPPDVIPGLYSFGIEPHEGMVIPGVARAKLSWGTARTMAPCLTLIATQWGREEGTL